jgi:hypothetical protein
MYFTNILEAVGESIFRLEAPVTAVNLMWQAYFFKETHYSLIGQKPSNNGLHVAGGV